ncbi:MAG: protease complex subunit PrcB family protein [Lachnospiraceae bacterium]|nr:protease complex subunit PrcB family protein [Lachnospiraceae bacterium]
MMRAEANQKGWKMRIVCWILAALVFLLTGCGGKREADDGTEVEFTVEEERTIPEPLLQAIKENQEREIRMTFEDGADLYLIRGYGTQKTGGYSIAVEKCVENEEKLRFVTRLIGPKDAQQLPPDPSYPYIVVRVAATDKEVEIQ